MASFINDNPGLCLLAALCVLLAPYMIRLVRKEHPDADEEVHDEEAR